MPNPPPSIAPRAGRAAPLERPKRRAPARRAAAIGLLALLGGATPLAAQTQVQACSAASAGELSVQAGVQCECRFFQPSAMAGTPAGYRWDCGILRPRVPDAVPVDLNPYPYPLPEGLSLELPTGQDPHSARPGQR